MNLIGKSLTAVIIVLFLVGCSNGPSSSNINIALEQYAFSNALDGVFAIKNIKKTNGYL